MTKSTTLKLYDESEEHKLTISSTVAGQKLKHDTNVRLSAPDSFSFTNTDTQSDNDFISFVTSRRVEDSNFELSATSLDGRIADTETLIADEGIAYLAHKAAIETALTNEEARSIAATDALSASLAQTTADRIASATAIDGKIDTAIADRQTGVTEYNTQVQTGIQETETQKTTGDNAVTSRIDTLMSVGEIDKTKLMEAVNEYQSADTAQIALISGIQTDFDALKVRIDDVLAQEAAGGASSVFDVKVTGTHYAGSSLLKIRLLEPDAQVMYDTLQQGDQLKITFDSGGEEIVTFDNFSNYMATSYYYMNLQAPVTLHYFQPDVTIELL